LRAEGMWEAKKMLYNTEIKEFLSSEQGIGEH
jgi:hypothetical protein